MPIMIKIEVTLLRLASPCPTLPIKSIKNIFFVISRSFFFKLEMLRTKVVEKIETQILCLKTFF